MQHCTLLRLLIVKLHGCHLMCKWILIVYAFPNYFCCAGNAVHAVLAEAQDASMQQGCKQALLQVAAAATLAAAVHAVESKEQMTKRMRNLPDEAQIFADGFALGLAFVMEVRK